MKATFLGTSDAQGVPRLLCTCRGCSDGKINRTRSSLLLELDGSKVLIDVSPDFRSQFLRELKDIPDEILITHTHYDHVGGFGDLIDLCFWNRKLVTVTSPGEVVEDLLVKFPYAEGKRYMKFNRTKEHKIKDWNITFFKVNHGANGFSYAIKLSKGGRTAVYMPDSFNLEDEQLQHLYGTDYLIIGTSYWDEQTAIETRSVYSTVEAMELVQKIKPKQVWFTHLSHDPAFLAHDLPDHMAFASDGLTIEMEV
ncbi:MBL fold metallo-hydrolase [Peribacillus kribbensis]|uniref:MBL fold metallo-hydrolase n=1 Tax=Peribacillus kribbensis TaxID=356658 RepID=UPI0004067BA9|nr:MBL fold metallo-hydrolase [Peribacillus kribbensis]